MLSILTKFFGIMLISMVAHKIISFALVLILGVIVYIAFTNPELVSTITTKLKELLENIDLNNINLEGIEQKIAK
ncbi:MAG TPA: hypothetical protein VLL98_05665 [Rickettsiales bacterium]|nr:hypothetical protein [Rickettsiales bacterium]